MALPPRAAGRQSAARLPVRVQALGAAGRAPFGSAVAPPAAPGPAVAAARRERDGAGGRGRQRGRVGRPRPSRSAPPTLKPAAPRRRALGRRSGDGGDRGRGRARRGAAFRLGGGGQPRPGGRARGAMGRCRSRRVRAPTGAAAAAAADGGAGRRSRRRRRAARAHRARHCGGASPALDAAAFPADVAATRAPREIAPEALPPQARRAAAAPPPRWPRASTSRRDGSRGGRGRAVRERRTAARCARRGGHGRERGGRAPPPRARRPRCRGRQHAARVDRRWRFGTPKRPELGGALRGQPIKEGRRGRAREGGRGELLTLPPPSGCIPPAPKRRRSACRRRRSRPRPRWPPRTGAAAADPRARRPPPRRPLPRRRSAVRAAGGRAERTRRRGRARRRSRGRRPGAAVRVGGTGRSGQPLRARGVVRPPHQRRRAPTRTVRAAGLPRRRAHVWLPEDGGRAAQRAPAPVADAPDSGGIADDVAALGRRHRRACAATARAR